MKTGRPPKPTRLKLLTGNPGKRPLNAKEPKFEPLAAVPPCPTQLLGEIGRQTWDHYAPQLVTTGVLTSADIHVLVTFCDAWERWVECSTDVRANGSVLESEGKLIRNPASVALSDAWKVVRECSALLGLDPSSRSKLAVEQPEEKNPFLELMQ